MSAADIAINIAAQFTGKTAFDKAENSAAKLQKSVKSLGKQLGFALGTAALVNFGKQSVKAFAADDNAARSLAKTLQNLGLSNQYAGQELNGYISRLEKQTGVLDDELRPAMDRLLRATGDITKSQDLLALALDVSAGTGKDLTAVSQGLQKAYLGNNASLGRLGVGLTKAELKSSSFLDIQKKLNVLFAGQAKDAADSFQGSLNKLTVASNNAKEAIGKGLVEALSILTGGNGNVDNAVTGIEKFSEGIASSAKNIAYMVNQFKSLLPLLAVIGGALLIAFAPVTAAIAALGFILAKGGQNLKKAAFAKGVIPGGMGNVSMTGGSNQDVQKSIKLQKQQNELKKIDNALTTRKITLTADQQALEELKKKFDVERIGLYAALNNATDEETKLRLKSLIAIHDNDAALAGKIKAEEEAARIAALLAESLKASLVAWGNWQSMIGSSFNAAAMLAAQTPATSITSPSQTYVPAPYAPGDIPGITGQRGFNFSGASASNVVINIDPAVSGLINVIQDQSASGISPTVNRVSSSYIA
jgi:hypothetical protein